MNRYTIVSFLALLIVVAAIPVYALYEAGRMDGAQVALTELVANAWDAGATRVDLILPAEIGGTLTVTDNGHGMTPAQFKKRWMTLRYDRLKHQGPNVEFPSGRHVRPRRAYGRNGIGRHGLLCFSDEYEVQTWCDEVLATFVVGTEFALYVTQDGGASTMEKGLD